jgi:hypothetical protein
LVQQYIYANDDVMYTYVRTADGRDYGHRVSSLWDAILSQRYDYFVWNGRVFAHTFVQWMCGVKYGLQVFYSLSAGFFALLLVGAQKNIKYINNGNGALLFFVVLLLVIFPSPGKTLFGNVSFTVNYLWSSAISIWVIYLFMRVCDGSYLTGYRYWTLCILFFVASICHEGFSIPISAVMLAWITTNYKSCHKRIFLLCVIYWIGTIFVSINPANVSRLFSGQVAGSQASYISRVIGVFWGLIKGNYAMVTFLFILILTVVFRKRANNFFRKNSAFYLVAIVSLSFALFVGYVGNHQLAPMCLSLIIILVGLYVRFIKYNHKVFNMIVNYLCIVVLLLGYFKVYQVRSELKQEWDDMHDKPQEILDATAVYKSIVNCPDWFKEYTFIDNMRLHLEGNPYFVKLSSVIATNGKQQDGVKSILPNRVENIISECNPRNKISEYIYNGGTFAIVRVPEQNVSSDMSVFYLNSRSTYAKLVGKVYTPNEVNIPFQEHGFRSDGFAYAVVFLNPNDIEKIWIE